MRDEDFENIDAGPPLILIPEGYYPADCLGYQAWKYGPEWGERLIVAWKVILSIDQQHTVDLTSYYTIRRNPAGRFCATDRCGYHRDWIKANDGKLPTRRNCLPFHVLMSRRMLVAVETVMRDSKKRPLHPSSHYSKVGCILRPLRDTDLIKPFPLQAEDIP
jgi:hypothetical protein